MTVFYHGPSARITHEVFETRIPEYRLFPIRDLTGIHIIRETERSILATPWARAASTVMVVVAIAVGAAAFWAVGSPSIAITACFASRSICVRKGQAGVVNIIVNETRSPSISRARIMFSVTRS